MAKIKTKPANIKALEFAGNALDRMLKKVDPNDEEQNEIHQLIIETKANLLKIANEVEGIIEEPPPSPQMPNKVNFGGSATNPNPTKKDE